MTPRRVITTIVSWVIAPAIAAALIAIPAGVVLEHAVAQTTVNGQTSALSHAPPPAALQDAQVYTVPVLRAPPLRLTAATKLRLRAETAHG